MGGNHSFHDKLDLNFPHLLYLGGVPAQRSKEPFQSGLKPVDWKGIDLWCEEQFGPSAVTGRWQDREVHEDRYWYRSAYKMFFRREEDAFAFKLRWL